MSGASAEIVSGDTGQETELYSVRPSLEHRCHGTPAFLSLCARIHMCVGVDGNIGQMTTLPVTLSHSPPYFYNKVSC